MGAHPQLSSTGCGSTAQHGTGIAQHCPCRLLLLQSPSLPASCLMHSPHSLPTNFTQPRGKCLTPSSECSLLNQPPIIQFGRQLKPSHAFHTASPISLPVGGCSTSSPHEAHAAHTHTAIELWDPWERPLTAPHRASIRAQHRSPGRLILNP